MTCIAYIINFASPEIKFLALPLSAIHSSPHSLHKSKLIVTSNLTIQMGFSQTCTCLAYIINFACPAIKFLALPSTPVHIVCTSPN